MIQNLYMGNGWKSPFPPIYKWLFGLPGSFVWRVKVGFVWSCLVMFPFWKPRFGNGKIHPLKICIYIYIFPAGLATFSGPEIQRYGPSAKKKWWKKYTSSVSNSRGGMPTKTPCPESIFSGLQKMCISHGPTDRWNTTKGEVRLWSSCSSPASECLVYLLFIQLFINICPIYVAWEKIIIQASSKWPFDHPNRGHLAPEKVT